MKTTRIPSILLATALALSPLAALADTDPDLIAYDGFDYAVNSSIEFQNGGTGWGGPWQFRQQIDGKGGVVQNAAYVFEGSLTYQGLVTSGNHVRLYGDFGSVELGRRFAETITGAPGTRTYFSFLGQRVGPAADPSDPVYTATDPDSGEEYQNYPWGDNLYPRGASWRIFNNTNGEVLQIGNLSNKSYDLWTLGAQGLDKTDDSRSNTSFSEAVAFVVVRVDHNGDTTVPDDFYMWVNPDLSRPDDTSTAEVRMVGMYEPGTQSEGNPDGRPFSLTNLAWISPWAGNASFVDGVVQRPHAEMLMDEMRVGRTWNSVVPLDGDPPPPVDPDPGYYADAILGGYYYLGSGWALWMPDADADDWGVVYLKLRDGEGAGWVWHGAKGWLYFMDGSPDEGMFIDSVDHGWLYTGGALGKWYHAYDANSFGSWAP
jgi:hypothetical protein